MFDRDEFDIDHVISSWPEITEGSNPAMITNGKCPA
jgi:hypothetical protein